MIHPEVRAFTYSCALARGARAAMTTAQQANTLNRNVKWALGGFKSEAKWANQMNSLGWTSEKITEAISRGKTFTPAKPNYINPGNPTMGFIHPETGQYLIRDEVTNEILQLGGPNFVP